MSVESTSQKRFLEEFSSEKLIIPEIRRVSNIVLIGVPHETMKMNPTFVKPFRQELLSTDWLLMEASSRFKSEIIGEDRWEGLALRILRQTGKEDRAIFLEEDLNYSAIMAKYDIDPYKFFLYRIINAYSKAIYGGVKILNLLNATSKLDLAKIGWVEELDNARFNFEINHLLQNLEGLIQNERLTSDEVANLFGSCGFTFKFYLARLRDYEIIIPNIKRCTEQFTGKITVLVGHKHLYLISKALEEEEIIKPDAWQTFLEKLPQEHKFPFQFIEELCQQLG